MNPGHEIDEIKARAQTINILTPRRGGRDLFRREKPSFTHKTVRTGYKYYLITLAFDSTLSNMGAKIRASFFIFLLFFPHVYVYLRCHRFMRNLVLREAQRLSKMSAA